MVSALSFAFPVLGEHGAANLGLPDLLFFGLFLAAAHRFKLRVNVTWVLLTASFGATMALAVWKDPFGIGGLPEQFFKCFVGGDGEEAARAEQGHKPGLKDALVGQVADAPPA